MRLGVLFSGGKDSCFATLKAMKDHDVVCLITLTSENSESFMFHVPNIGLTELQSEAAGIPLVSVKTPGIKEEELRDMERAILIAKEKYDIEGIVTGAVKSTYQSSRIQKVCKKLDLWCFNPLWLMDEIELLGEIAKSGMHVVISGVFAFPMDESFLGKSLDSELIAKLSEMKEKHGINPAGEGGEIETTVLDAPFFTKRLSILESETRYNNYSGIFRIIKSELVKK
jgi:diphthine-ammonia ligase